MAMTAPAAQTTPKADSALRQHAEMLRKHLEILRQLNASASVIALVEQAIAEAEAARIRHT